jgi:hypothetical protein
MVRADSTSSVTLGSNKRVGFEEKRIEEEKRRNYDGVKSGCCCVVTVLLQPNCSYRIKPAGREICFLGNARLPFSH